MEPLNQNEWLIRFKRVNREIVDALFQMNQNVDAQIERTNQDSSNENLLPCGLHSNVEMPNDVFLRERTHFQLQEESNQENVSLNQNQTKSDDCTSFESHENELCDDDQACAPILDQPGYVCAVHITNSEQGKFPDIEQPSFANIHNSNSNSETILNKIVEKPYICEFCNKNFNSKSNLEYHMIVHTGEKSFSCYVCGKQFGLEHNLTRHMLTHSNEKPFKCRFCYKKITQPSSVEEHELICSKRRPYICDICKRGYTHKGYLEYHMFLHD